MEPESSGGVSCFFSVCIPQYNRTSFLLRLLESLETQTFRDFEVCISDDCSTDGRSQEILDCLGKTRLRFLYTKTDRNLHYDKNLRRAIGLAKGRYCFLLGNDDMLAGPGTLARLHAFIQDYRCPEVVITNYRELSTGVLYRRMQTTGLLGSGPAVAVDNFRNFSFMSGLVFSREQTSRHATDQWDIAAFYQTFLGCRIIAEGGRLLGVSEAVILKDIQIPGEQVDSYRTFPVLRNCQIVARPLNLAPIGRLVFGAVEPFVDARSRERTARQIFGQVLLYTYPPWLFEFRNIQSWRYAAGVALGMRPKYLLEDLRFGVVTKSYLTLLHLAVSSVGLLAPTFLFSRLKPWLHRFAKRRRTPTRPSPCTI